MKTFITDEMVEIAARLPVWELRDNEPDNAHTRMRKRLEAVAPLIIGATLERAAYAMFKRESVDDPPQSWVQVADIVAELDDQ